jgi:hypothetical protein
LVVFFFDCPIRPIPRSRFHILAVRRCVVFHAPTLPSTSPITRSSTPEAPALAHRPAPVATASRGGVGGICTGESRRVSAQRRDVGISRVGSVGSRIRNLDGVRELFPGEPLRGSVI